MADANSTRTVFALDALGSADDTLNHAQAVLDGIETFGAKILGHLPDGDKELEAFSMAVCSMALDVSGRLSKALDAIAAARTVLEQKCEVVHG